MKNKDIQEELENISQPVARHLEAGRIWRVPDEYFSENENFLMKHVLLSEGMYLNHAGIPEGYFEQNEGTLMRQLTHRLFPVKIWMRVAAAVGILITAIVIWQNNRLDQPGDTELAIQYLNENLDEFDTDDFVDYQLVEEDFIESLPTFEWLSRDSLEAEKILNNTGDFFHEESEDLF